MDCFSSSNEFTSTTPPVTAAALGCTAELIQGHVVICAPTATIAAHAVLQLRHWSVPILICLGHIGGEPYALLNSP